MLVRRGMGVGSISGRRTRYADFSSATPSSVPFCGSTRTLARKKLNDQAQPSRCIRSEPTAMCWPCVRTVARSFGECRDRGAANAIWAERGTFKIAPPRRRLLPQARGRRANRIYTHFSSHHHPMGRYRHETRQRGRGPLSEKHNMMHQPHRISKS